MKFKVRDKVSWMGLIGEVISTTFYGRDSSYPVRVRFDTHDVFDKMFTPDGHYYSCHTEPSLKLIERPKKKVKKTFYTGAYQSGTLTGYSVDGLLVENKEEAIEKFKNYDMGIVEIVLEVEE